MKRFIFSVVFFILGTLAFSAEVGEKTYKEVTVNGKTLSKLVEVYSVIEYDRNGNEIHFKENDGYEYWCEYDSNGNLIHSQNSHGLEKWYEYDSNGNQIHYKDNDGEEYWHEYTYWKNGKVKTKTEYHAL